jgi:C4-dicarboxylate-specific signal transduction histidine kinase
MLEERTIPSAQRELELVRREASRAAQIVRNLLSFIRRSTPNRMAVDLNDAVRAMVELRHYHLERTDIALDVALHPDPLPVFVNREEIQQIILNLILNAEQALRSARRSRLDSHFHGRPPSASRSPTTVRDQQRAARKI